MHTTSRSAVIGLLLDHGSLSRAQLARYSGMSRASITLAVADLLAGGLLVETGTSQSTGGRKPVMLRLGGERHFVAGVVVTPRRLLLARVDLDGNVLQRIEGRAPSSTEVDDVVAAVTAGVDALFAGMDHSSLLGCGVSISSIANAVTGTISSSAFAWTNVPLQPALEQALRVPTQVIDNAHGAALGELWLHGRELRENLIYCYLGSGVGGAVIIGRDLYVGRNHAAGELGPVIVDVDGPMFPCGHRGCLEGFTSDEHLLAQFRRWRALGESSTIPPDISPAELVDRIAEAAEDDPAAHRVMAYAAGYVGVVCANLINLLNPDEIIIGGPLARWGTRFSKLIAEVATRTALAIPMESVRIIPGDAEDVVVPLGAAATVIKHAATLIEDRQIGAKTPGAIDGQAAAATTNV